VILLVNGILLLLVAICIGKLVLELLRRSPNSDRTDLLISVILTVTAYIYSIVVAKGSVRAFEKNGEITNITQILRLYSIVYYLGFCLVYWIVIIKLAERDYLLLSYFLYIVILSVCFIAVRVFATTPKIQDVWILAVLIIVTNLLHAVSIVFQYIFLEASQFWYFLQDLGVLIGMAVLALYTLFGNWKVK
jgi:hypothetical protein